MNHGLINGPKTYRKVKDEREDNNPVYVRDGDSFG